MHKWAIHQVDVNNTFLNGVLVEDVYIAQPEGFVDPSKPYHIGKLKKTFCGSKQALRTWFDRLKATIVLQ